MAGLTHAKRVDSNRLVQEYFDSWMIRWQFIGSQEPDMDYELFGRIYRTPILASGMGLHTRFHASGSLGYARGVHAAGSVSFNGWIEDEEMEAICGEGIPAVRGIKPFADHGRILRCIEHDEKCGAIAVCMDIDHILSPTGRYEEAPYGKLGRQTVGDLTTYAQATRLPLILKGVMTAEDAQKALEAGAGAVIISNHNNRFPSTVPPLVALPEVKAVLGGKIPVLVDGCIESGTEAFKALALGADGILVGRAILGAFSKEGPEGVTHKIEEITAQLAGCMANTGAADISGIRASSLCRRTF